jgi:hypothetical protein
MKYVNASIYIEHEVWPNQISNLKSDLLVYIQKKKSKIKMSQSL